MPPNPEAQSGARRVVPLVAGRRLPASMPFRRLDRRTLRPVIGAIPAVPVMKDLVLSRLSLELDEKNSLHL